MDALATHQAQDSYDFPVELTYTPIPFIFLVGLDITNNTTHATVWNTFTTNRLQDRVLLYFKLGEEALGFTQAKPKKVNYEWEPPRGILKTKWVAKHLFEIPAVIVLFVELDWDDEAWEEKKAICVTRVDHIKQQLVGRCCRLAMVLIQRSTAVHEENFVTERAAQIYTACELNPNSLFVLPFSEDYSQLLGYVTMIENALLNLARSYYQQKAKEVQAYRDQLSKSTHDLLFARHEFKIALFNELRHDNSGALQHYKQAYSFLMEVKATANNLHEIKIMSGILTYKICRLAFHGNCPVDAISHFRRHMDIMRNKSEPNHLLFEHKAWVSRQFQMFANLFDGAVTSGLSPSQIHNPGYYFYEAATEAILRRDIFLKHHGNLFAGDSLSVSGISINQEPDFLGQRSWRSGYQTPEGGISDEESQGMQSLIWKESLVSNHSVTIITLLTSAAAHFKKNKCLRLKRYVTVLIAEEYFRLKDYSNSLLFYNQVISYYRLEPWSSIMSCVLYSALQAAYCDINIAEFFKLSFEFIALDCKTIEPTKIEIQNCVQAILAGAIPVFNAIPAEAICDQWTYKIQNTPKLSLVLDNLNSWIDFNVKFSRSEYSVNEEVKLEVYLLLNALEDLSFNSIQIVFTDPYYNSFCYSKSGVSSEDFVLKPDQVKTLSFTFKPTSETVGKPISATQLLLSIGSQVETLLTWNMNKRSNCQVGRVRPWYKSKQHIASFKEIKWFHNIESIISTTIKPTE